MSTTLNLLFHTSIKNIKKFFNVVVAPEPSHFAMLARWGVDVVFHILDFVADEGEWSVSRCGRFPPGKEPSVPIA
jgi:hypothetical protein